MMQNPGGKVDLGKRSDRHSQESISGEYLRRDKRYKVVMRDDVMNRDKNTEELVRLIDWVIDLVD